MFSLVWVLIQVGIVILGLLSLFVATVATEAEDRRAEDLLVRFWVAVDDLRQKGVSLQAAIARVSARVTSRAIEKLLGPKLFSLRSAWVSASTSVASLFVLMLILVIWQRNAPGMLEKGNVHFVILAFGGLSGIAVALALATGLDPWVAPALWIATLYRIALWLVEQRRLFEYELADFIVGGVFFVVVIGVMSDLIAIWIMRGVLRWVDRRERSFLRITFALLLAFSVALTLVLGPLVSGVAIATKGFSLDSIVALSESTKISMGIWFLILVLSAMISVSNVLTALFVLVYATAVAVPIICRVVMTTADRVSYMFAKEPVAKNKRMFLYAGFLLLSAGGLPTIVSALRLYPLR